MFLETADVLIDKMRVELLEKNAIISYLCHRIKHLETALATTSRSKANVDSSSNLGPCLAGENFSGSHSLESDLHSLLFLDKYEECQNLLLLAIEENEALEARLREAEDIIEYLHRHFDVI